MAVKRIPKRKPTRRETRTIPIYASPTQLRPFKLDPYSLPEWAGVSEGHPAPLERQIQWAGEVVPKTKNVGGATYFFYKRVSLRGTVKKIIDKLRKQGYKARNYQVKRHIGRRALVVDNAIYTRPEHPNASVNR